MGHGAVMLRVGAIVAALLLAALGYQTWRANHAVKQLERTRVELDIATAQVKTLDEARVLDTRTADALAGIRNDMAARNREFGRKLDSIKVTREVPREGDTCIERDPAAYRGLFNEALGEAPGTDSLF